MAQEFTIKSQQIEDKINQLLPSQGGFQAGVDFSASTMVIPIVDLTETAEGSSLRQDLQTSLSLTSATPYLVFNTTTTIINTTGYFSLLISDELQGAGTITYNITDGTTTKVLFRNVGASGMTTTPKTSFNNLNVFLQAGDSITVESTSTNVFGRGVTRQIADISGNLINP
jgi:hypothetical protein